MTCDRIAIIGAGAVGGVAAAALTEVGHEVTLCARRAILKLVVEINEEVHDVPVRLVTDPAVLSSVDWVLLATKAQDTPGTASWLKRLVGPDTVIVVLQNGIDHVDRVVKITPQGQVLPVVVYAPGEVIAPGHVRAHGQQKFIVPKNLAGSAFAGLFAGSAIDVQQTDDFMTIAWRKLLANVSANPITALTLCRISIMSDPEIRIFAKALLSEAVTVGRAMGAKLEETEIDCFLNSYEHLDPNGGTSMLYDRLAGRATEHEYLTGALVKAAADKGIDVPFNRAVLALLRGVQRSLLESQKETA